MSRRCDCALGGREPTDCDCPGEPDRAKAMASWVAAHSPQQVAARLIELDDALGQTLDGLAEPGLAVPTDRAQDTEAIRAAPQVEGEVPAQWYLDMRAERDRLEARLEAAETRLSVAHAYIPSRDFADYEGDANAALAAASPGGEGGGRPDGVAVAETQRVR